MTKTPICFHCKHFVEGKEYKCAAFPNAIPAEIIHGKIGHDAPLPGQDNNLTFLPLTDEEFQQRFS